MTLDFDVERFNDAVAESEEQHHESMRTFDGDIRELHAETRRALGGTSRRDLLIRSAVATTALSFGSQLLPLRGFFTGVAAAQVVTDSDIAAFAASLEYAAVATYGAAAATGMLSKPVADAAATFAAQHKAHGDAFAAASDDKILPDSPNKTIQSALLTRMSQAQTEMDIVKLAFEVENTAAATYQAALGSMEAVRYQQLVASILPIEAGHAAVLGQILFMGDPKRDKEDAWLPAFQTEAGAVDATTNPLT